jgi:hypothetical protein
VHHKPGIDKDIVLGIREIARQTRIIRASMPSHSNNDVYSAIDWNAGRVTEAAQMLNRMHRRRSRSPDYPPPWKGQ